MSSAPKSPRPQRQHVTAGQLRVLGALVTGGSYADIARMLFLSPTTVRSHVAALQERFGVSNNVALVLAAVTVGLLSTTAWPATLTGLTDFDPADLGQ